MKALWRKYFYISPDEPVSDRVFMARLSVDVGLILLYMACMAYAAYVLFQSGPAVAI